MSYPDEIRPDFSGREVDDSVEFVLAKRWSPRAFKPYEISEKDIITMFEAARIAPSCYNDQPWRFYISTDDTRNDYLNLLVDANKEWAQNASIIGFIVASTKFDHNGNDNGFASFDCGAAWMSLTVQARALGLYTHGMGGIKYDDVSAYLNIDNDHKVLCGFAIGVAAEPSILPERTQKSESPTPRKPLSEILLR